VRAFLRKAIRRGDHHCLVCDVNSNRCGPDRHPDPDVNAAAGVYCNPYDRADPHGDADGDPHGDADTHA